MCSDPGGRLAKGLVAAALLAATLGCGKQGPPLPPLRNVPAPTKDLTVVQQGPRLLASFTYPTVTPAGTALAGVSAVEIWSTARPAAPQQVTITPRGDGIQIEWAPVAGTVAGYNVYRRGAQERSNGKPVHTGGAAEKSWLDTTARFGQNYIYSVTALSQLQPPIESAIASEHEVHYIDRFAPPPPAELVALTEAGRVRLVWRASEAEDVVGYIVYRRVDETGKFERVTAKPVESTEFSDTAVGSARTYIYRVTAVDQAGNESGPSNEVRAAVP